MESGGRKSQERDSIIIQTITVCVDVHSKRRQTVNGGYPGEQEKEVFSVAAFFFLVFFFFLFHKHVLHL